MEKPKKKQKSKSISIKQFVKNQSMNSAALRTLVNESHFLKKNLKYDEKENVSLQNNKKKKKKRLQ